MKKLLVSLFFLCAMILLFTHEVLGVEYGISNVYVTEDGNVTWSAYPGAASYQVGLEDNWNSITVNTNDSLNITTPGTYTYRIKAFSDTEGANLLKEYEGRVKYDGNSCMALYAVEFALDENTIVSTQYIEPQGVAVEPEIPYKDGYTFLNWCYNPDLPYSYDFHQPVMSNITLFANFVEDSRVITSLNLTVALPNVGDQVTMIQDDPRAPEMPSVSPLISVNNENVEAMGYYIDTTKSQNAYGEYPLYYGTFEQGKTYGLLIDLSIKENSDCYLDRDMQVYVNGKLAQLRTYNAAKFRGLYSSITLPGTPEENTDENSESAENTTDGANSEENNVSEEMASVDENGNILYEITEKGAGTGDTVGATQNGEENINGGQAEKTAASKKKNPITGDNIYIWITLALASIVLTYSIKKIYPKKKKIGFKKF